VRNQREREQSSSRPPDEQCDRAREQRTDPAEVSSDAAVTLQLGDALRGQRTGEKNSEEKKYNPADLARERGRRRPIVPVRARAS